ncbi:4Fe-4S dicluster domain-containing protein [Puteibacter caeruleilacunae]|nr:4Fe-4S dicluster domain-containing protein [Puteibacter caeruleilacunae]
MKVYLVYFSPSGSTKKTVRNVAKGIDATEVIEIDMLKKSNREKTHSFGPNDLVILGMMTATKLYGIPAEVMGALKGNNTPLVGAVNCGNGYFGSSLIAMQKFMSKQGFKMMAAGGFIGQYSFSKSIATNRPDEQDAAIQFQFGKDIAKKLQQGDLNLYSKLSIDWPNEGTFSTIKCAIGSALPGPGFSIPKSWNELAIADDCIQCGKCVKHCPVGALSLNGKITQDRDKCIGCQGCVNVCPREAINPINESLQKMVANVMKFRQGRKEPKLFL